MEGILQKILTGYTDVEIYMRAINVKNKFKTVQVLCLAYRLSNDLKKVVLPTPALPTTAIRFRNFLASPSL